MAVSFLDITARTVTPSSNTPNLRTLLILEEGSAQTTREAAVRIRAMKEFPTLKEFTDEYDATTEADLRDGARTYFQGVPFPNALLVAYHITTAQNSYVFGGEPASVATIEALGDGATFQLGGETVTVNLDTLNSISTIAGAVQSGLQNVGGWGGVTCAVVEGNLVINGGQVAFPDGVTESSVAEALGLSEAGGGVTVQPVGAETVDNTLDRLKQVSNEFGVIIPGTELTSNASGLVRFAHWSNTNNKSTFFDQTGPAVLVQNESTSTLQSVIAGLSSDEEASKRIAAIWNRRSTVDHKALAMAAYYSTIDITKENAFRTIANKLLPGTSSVELLNSEANELDRKRCNYYRKEGRNQYVRKGQMLGQAYIHETLVSQLLLDHVNQQIFDLMQDPTVSVGQSDDSNELLSVLTEVGDLFVTNGAFAPGSISREVSDEIARISGGRFGRSFSEGYWVWRPPYSTLSASDRAEGKSVPHYLYGRLAGIVINPVIRLVFNG